MVSMKHTQTMPSQDADAWVSALLDGELDDGEAKRALGRFPGEADASARWAEYNLISDALHGDAADTSDFMVRFRKSLDDEPTVLAPVPARKVQTGPYLWTAAAAAMAAITWTVWTAAPPDSGSERMAAAQTVAANDPRSGVDPVANQLEPYLAAHQDYAYAVVSVPEIVIEKVSLAGPNQ
jgi:negative regulator of sigma E activity